MNLLQELLRFSEDAEQEKDFFHMLTKFDRTAWSHAQDYGFHHHLDKSEYHGRFATDDCSGKVFKKAHPDGSATYTCQFDEGNLLDEYQRLEQILIAVKASSLGRWVFVPLSTYKTCKDPCFTVIRGSKPGDVDICVRQDLHPAAGIVK